MNLKKICQLSDCWIVWDERGMPRYSRAAVAGQEITICGDCNDRILQVAPMSRYEVGRELSGWVIFDNEKKPGEQIIAGFGDDEGRARSRCLELNLKELEK